jgi:hypothetical protein
MKQLSGIRSVVGACVLAVACSSCAWTPTLVESGLAGTAVGAGTGAAVGSLISNGNVLASAGLGAAIGLPAGLALGSYYLEHLEQQRLVEQRLKVLEQHRELYRNERELERIREQVWADSPKQLDQDRRNIYYDGETLGSFYR